MRRILSLLVLVAIVASVVVAAGQGASLHAQGAKLRALDIQVSLIQEQTIRHPHPPAGDAGDTFSTTLRMVTIAKTLGFPPKTPLGRIAFSWGPLDGSCSASVAGCSGTTNLNALIMLPGGTITAGGDHLSLAHGEILPVVSGTGAFKGAHGKLTFLSVQKEGVLDLTVPV